MSEKVLPIPCTKVEEETIKDWFQKINEELDEFKIDVLAGEMFDLDDASYVLRKYLHVECQKNIAEDAADIITAITSMLEAMGIDENMRQEAQKLINEKNRERGMF